MDSENFQNWIIHDVSWDDINERLPSKISMKEIRLWGEDLLPSQVLGHVREYNYRFGMPPIWFLKKYTDDVILDDWWEMVCDYIFSNHVRDNYLDSNKSQYKKDVLDLFSSWLDRMVVEATENDNGNSNLRDEFEHRLIQGFIYVANVREIEFDFENYIIKLFPNLVHDIINWDLSESELHCKDELYYERRGPDEYSRCVPQWNWTRDGSRGEETIVEVSLDDSEDTRDGQFRKDRRQNLVVAYNGVWKERLLEYYFPHSNIEDPLPLPLLVIKSFFMSLQHSRYFANDDPQKRLGFPCDPCDLCCVHSWITSMMTIEKETSLRFSTDGCDTQALSGEVIAAVLFELFDKVKLHPFQLDKVNEAIRFRVAPYENTAWRTLLKDVLIVRYPQAITQRNANGQLLLHALLENGLPGQDILVKADPLAIKEVCPRTGFLPFQLAALPKNYFWEQDLVDSSDDDSSDDEDEEEDDEEDEDEDEDDEARRLVIAQAEADQESRRLVSASEAEADEVTKIYDLLRFEPGQNFHPGFEYQGSPSDADTKERVQQILLGIVNCKERGFDSITI